MKWNWYAMISEESSYRDVICDDGTGPTEYFRQTACIKAKSPQAARRLIYLMARSIGRREFWSIHSDTKWFVHRVRKPKSKAKLGFNWDCVNPKFPKGLERRAYGSQK